MNVTENKLVDKDKIIKELGDKVKSLMDNVSIKDIVEIENNDPKDTEFDKTICNPSDVLKRCPHCSLKHISRMTW